MSSRTGSYPRWFVALLALAGATVAAQDTDVVVVDSGTEYGIGVYPTMLDPIPPSQQVSATKSSAITSTEYVHRRLQLVSASDRFEFPGILLRVKNDGVADTDFQVTFDNSSSSLGSRIPFGWRLRFCPDDGSGACDSPIVERGPEDAATAVAISVPVGGSVDYHVQLIPRWDTLFNGGSADIEVEVTKVSDASSDVARFQATTSRLDPTTAALCSPFSPPPPPVQFVEASVTLPFFDEVSSAIFTGRPALMVTQSILTNSNNNSNRRLGDVKFYYADCLLSATAGEKAVNCETGEDATDPDTLSLLDDGQTPAHTVGLGWVLSQMTPGTANVPANNAVRQIYYTSNGSPAVSAPHDSYAMTNFDLSACSTLRGSGFMDTADAIWLGSLDDCSDTSTPWVDRTQRLIAFMRGNAVSAFAADNQRLVTAADQSFDPPPTGGGDEIELLGDVTVGTRWLLPDLVGSPPIIIGPPNLFTRTDTNFVSADFDVWARQDARQQRSIVAYLMDNLGVVHAFELATFISGSPPPGKHYFRGYTSSFSDTFVRELWAYVPKGALANLKYAVSNDHHYFGDGLLRATDIQMKLANGTFDSSDFRTVLVGHQGRSGGGIFALDVTDPSSPKVFWDYACEENSHAGTAVDGDCDNGDELAVQAAPVIGRLVDSSDTAGYKWVVMYGSGAPVSDVVDDYRSRESWITVREIQGGGVVKQVRVSETANDKQGNLLTDLIMLRDIATGDVEALYFGDYYGALWRVRDERLAPSGASGITDGNGLVETQDMLYEPSDYDSNTIAAAAERPITARPRIAIDAYQTFWTYFGSGAYLYDLNTSGSGDFGVDNNHQRFFGLRDPILTAKYSGTTGLVNMSDQVDGSGNLNNNSWYVELGQAVTGGATGRTIAERVLEPAVVFGGLACFTTFQLPTNANRCTTDGIERLYCVDFESGRADVATDPRLTSSSFQRNESAPTGSPLVLPQRSGNALPPKIVPGGPLDEIDASVSIEASSRRACELLMWRDLR